MSGTSERTLPRTRPRGDLRKQELADVAERMFLSHGFADTTMQMIAQEARASKETLYRHFTSKEALFAEIMHARSLRLLGSEERIDPDVPVRDVLFGFGCRLLEGLLTPDRLALYRIVIAETPRAPELGRLFWSQGPAHAQERLTQFLASAVERGHLDCADPALATSLFLGAVISLHHTKALISATSASLTAKELREHVSEAVNLFLARYAPSASR